MSLAPLILVALAVVAILGSKRLPDAAQRVVLPLATGVIALALWHLWARSTEYDVKQQDGSLQHIKNFPVPAEVLPALIDLASDGRLLRYSIASVYRVSAGFALAALGGIPLGLWMGWRQRAAFAINPFVQALRFISPIAWIPVSIMAWGVDDAQKIFLIFLSAFFPIVMGTMTGVRTIPLAYVRAAQNFGLSGSELFRRVVLPASLPQIITSLRLALGIGWLVIVAAEFVNANSGLGFLVVDARNMGMRYDLVVAAMLAIGAIGVVLDFLIRRLERFDEVRWGFSKH